MKISSVSKKVLCGALSAAMVVAFAPTVAFGDTAPTASTITVNYAVGDTVKILDGPLTSFTGTVDSIDIDNNAVNVIVSMFGRETSVEFELDQIEVVSQ